MAERSPSAEVAHATPRSDNPFMMKCINPDGRCWQQLGTWERLSFMCSTTAGFGEVIRGECHHWRFPCQERRSGSGLFIGMSFLQQRQPDGSCRADECDRLVFPYCRDVADGLVAERSPSAEVAHATPRSDNPFMMKCLNPDGRCWQQLSFMCSTTAGFGEVIRGECDWWHFPCQETRSGGGLFIGMSFLQQRLPDGSCRADECDRHVSPYCGLS